jgi:hypothetical protein
MKSIHSLSLPFLALLLVALAVSGATYVVQASAEPGAGSALAEYRNDRLGLSLRYPEWMTVRETDEGNGAQSIAFDSDRAFGEGFYIMAIPYSQVNIAAEGFQPHEAYGLADQGLQLRTVDIVRTSTVQISFVKGGVIYQVVGGPGSEAWLTEILKTWQFTD